MSKVVVIAQIEDAAKWEKGFRTRGDLFRNSYTVTAPVSFAINERKEVAVCFEPADLKKAVEPSIPLRRPKPWPPMASNATL